MVRHLVRCALAVLVVVCHSHAAQGAGLGVGSWELGVEEPIPVKVVVVAMFELGADTGDRPGEFQHWVEGEKLDRVIGQYAAFLPALESACRVGSVVVDKLVADWAIYRDTPPTAAAR